MNADRMLLVEDLPSVFKDLSPIPQNDGPDRVCVIQYPSAFALSYNYMRAVWEAKEFSERALKLSATCLKLNPANYTVWNFRRRCLSSLGLSSDRETIRKDLELTASLGGENPKNYQIWYHRRALLETYGARDFMEEELAYIEEVLGIDSKNYHAWSYRQWILMTVDDDSIWEKEMGFVSRLIQEDVRNNSAWNQRWLVSHRGKRGNHPLSLDVARREADFAIEKGARLDPYNESPWRYLVGILREQHQRQQKDNIGSTDDFTRNVIAEYEAKASGLRTVLEEAQRNPDTCVNMTSARIDLLEMVGTKESLEVATQLATSLATEHDPFRKKYWWLVVKRLQNQAKSTSGS